MKDFTEVITLKPDLAMAYALRARAYLETGEYPKAWKDAHKAQELGMEFPPEFIEKLSEKMPEPED